MSEIEQEVNTEIAKAVKVKLKGDGSWLLALLIVTIIACGFVILTESICCYCLLRAPKENINGIQGPPLSEIKEVKAPTEVSVS